MWDITNIDASKSAISTLPCLNENYIRSVKLMKDGTTLIVGGETSNIAVFDLVVCFSFFWEGGPNGLVLAKRGWMMLGINADVF